MPSPGGERGAILSGGAPGPARPSTPRRAGPRQHVDAAEVAALSGLTLREAERRLDCTPVALRVALRAAKARVVHGVIEVADAGR